MSRIGLSGASGSRKAHLAVWAVVATLVFTLLGSVLPSGLGLTPAFAATSSLAKTKAELAQAKKELKSLQARLDKLAKQQASAEDDLETTKIRIQDVQTKLDAAQVDLDGLRAQLAGRLAEMYKNRQSDEATTFLNVLFAGEDSSVTAIVERLTMVTHIAQADTKLVNSVVDRVRELRILRADLVAQKAAESKKTAKYNAARDKTLASLENSKGDYSRLRKRVATLQAEALKREEEARAAAEARKVAAAAAAAAAKRKTTGTTSHKTTTTPKPRPPVVIAAFVFPVDGPNSFVDSFGAPRSGGRAHQGCDIMTARNTPLLAVVNGVITSTVPYDTGLGGITIHLRGGNGTVYYYAHLASIKAGIRAGVRVSAGEVIGYAGNTGNASGGSVHLHFEIRPNGRAAIDPYPTLIKYR